MDGLSRESLAETVRQALRSVIDPELGQNVVDLGLIYFVAVDDKGTAHVVMTTTTPGCPAVGYLREGVRQATISVAGIATAEVSVTYDPPWSPDMMSGEVAYRSDTWPHQTSKCRKLKNPLPTESRPYTAPDQTWRLRFSAYRAQRCRLEITSDRTVWPTADRHRHHSRG